MDHATNVVMLLHEAWAQLDVKISECRRCRAQDYDRICPDHRRAMHNLQEVQREMEA